MPIIAKDLMPGVRYEVWEHEITPTDLYESQNQFLEHMKVNQIPHYIIIVEPRPNVKLPPVSALLNSARRFPSGTVKYFVIKNTTFNTTIANIMVRISPFPITLYSDLAAATDAARALMEK